MASSARNDSARILLTGDVHIGRSSSRIPASIPREDLRAVAAWLRIVDYAIYENVDVVCLSGDIADQANKFWEAVGPLEQGIRRLAEAGIDTVAVSGNHDFDVLPRLAKQLPQASFKLLGQGGKWERHSICRSDTPLLHIDGWSFPAQRVYDSPLNSYDLDPDPNTPVLGLVHGDLGILDSPFAPLDLSKLESLPVVGWLLGHIHARRLIRNSGCPWVLYPGSPQALDPGETGLHGPWLVELERGQLRIPYQLPISCVRYETLEIDLSDTISAADVEDKILNSVRDYAESIVEESGNHLVHISLRLTLVGSTSVSHLVRETAKKAAEDLSLQFGDATLSIEKTEVETIPRIDIEEYACSTQSAPGALARLLMSLASNGIDEHIQSLLQESRQEIRQILQHRDFMQLEVPENTDELAISYLKMQARALLTELVSQTL